MRLLDSDLVQSYVTFLREEGAQAVLSSFPNLSRERLESMSLPLLSYCYFSSDDPILRNGWSDLFARDQHRSQAISGNDIFRSVTSELYREHEEAYRKATELIRTVWPGYYKIIQVINPRLAMTTAEDLFESASDPTTFGQIIYRMNSGCPVKWAEILVHELGHHYLNIIITTHNEQDVFNQPWDEAKYSAIRDTDRPLIGIYHGAFAQACMLELALRILRSKSTSSDEREGALRIIDRFQVTFEKDYQTIEERGLLSFDEHITEIIQATKADLAQALSESPSKVGVS